MYQKLKLRSLYSCIHNKLKKISQPDHKKVYFLPHLTLAGIPDMTNEGRDCMKEAYGVTLLIAVRWA